MRWPIRVNGVICPLLAIANRKSVGYSPQIITSRDQKGYSMAIIKGNELRKVVCVAVLSVFLSSCSAVMAARGSNPPDLGAVSTNKKRSEIEVHLGAPIKTTTLANGDRIDVYQYEIGNEPSLGRAVGNAALTLVTFGLWEIAGTPIEASAGDTYTATITYDKNDVVKDIKTLKVSS